MLPDYLASFWRTKQSWNFGNKWSCLDFCLPLTIPACQRMLLAICYAHPSRPHNFFHRAVPRKTNRRVTIKRSQLLVFLSLTKQVNLWISLSQHRNEMPFSDKKRREDKGRGTLWSVKGVAALSKRHRAEIYGTSENSSWQMTCQGVQKARNIWEHEAGMSGWS